MAADRLRRDPAVEVVEGSAAGGVPSRLRLQPEGRAHAVLDRSCPGVVRAGYDSLPKWWQYGFVASATNVLIFGIVGALWMGLVGIC